MNPIRPFLRFAVPALACGLCMAQSQFDFGAIYMMSPYHTPAGGSPYPGIARVDPFTGSVTPFVQFTTLPYPASAVYDPYRDRIVTPCGVGTMTNPVMMAIDASGNATQIANTILLKLAARGDGKIYGYKAGAGNPTIQKIFYLDAGNVEHELLDVGGGSPWLLNGGVTINAIDPIHSMSYEPSENALFLALHGDGAVPDCGAPSFDVSIRKLPLTADGTALRAPAVCTEHDVGGIANADERPYGFSYGPGGKLVLCVYANYSGAMPRMLQVDPVTAQMSPFVIVGPYTGDIGISCGVYSPLSNTVLVHEGFNDVFRSYAPGGSGAGQVLSSYGPPGLGPGQATMFVVTPIGPGLTLTADVHATSVTNGGVQNLDFHPGTPFDGQIYLLLGSLSGWAPGFTFAGAPIPLNLDWYSDFTLNAANSVFLVNTVGFFGGSGATQSQVNYPAGVLNGMQGLTMHHAGIVFDGTLQILHTSNPVPLQLLP